MNTRQCGDGVQTSILQTSLYNFDQAARRLALDDAVRQKVLGPKERIELNINPILSDGKVINVKIFVVRHNDVLGPAKGGIRMTPDVTLDDVTGLAMEMTWKTSLIGVPFGGGKSGICFDPTSVSADRRRSSSARSRAASGGTSGRKSTCPPPTWAPTNATWATSATASPTRRARRSPTAAS